MTPPLQQRPGALKESPTRRVTFNETPKEIAPEKGKGKGNEPKGGKSKGKGPKRPRPFWKGAKGKKEGPKGGGREPKEKAPNERRSPTPPK